MPVGARDGQRTAIASEQSGTGVALMARSVARHFEREGIVKVLPVRIELPLPPVGILTLRDRRPAPSSERLIECLRRAAKMR